VACSRGLDAVVFSDDAATDAAPAGLLHGVTPLAAGASMSEDLGALVEAIASSGVDPETTVFVAAPAQALAIRLAANSLFGSVYRVIGAPLPAGQVIAVASGAVVFSGGGLPQIETTKQGTIVFSDPGLPVSVVGSPNVINAPTRDLFQTASLCLRVIARATWASAPGSVAVVNSVTW
jgi:hypothetical protein